MENVTSRDLRQEGLMLDWKKAGALGGIKAHTSFGKTYMTIKYGIEPCLAKFQEGVCLIIVHRVAMKKQWEANIKNFPISQDIKDRVYVVVSNTIIIQGIMRKCTLLILDEVSEYYGAEEQAIWDKTYIDYKYALWLDATPKDTRGVWKKLYKLLPQVGEVLPEEGKRMGWITQCKIFNLGVELTEKERELYNEYSEDISLYLGMFSSDLDLANRCARGGKNKFGESFSNYDWAYEFAEKNGWDENYEQIAKLPKPPNMKLDDYRFYIETDQKWNPEKIIGYASNLFDTMRKRKYLLARCTNKLAMALKVIRKFEDQKIVSFSQSTDFAHNLHEAVTKHTDVKSVEYHSKIVGRPLRLNEFDKPSLFGKGDYQRVKTKSSANYDQPKNTGANTIKKLSLEWFTTTDKGLLSLGSALDKGLNVEDINIEIITSMNNKKAQHEQRKGRSVRNSEDKDLALMIYIYAKNTKDVSYLRNIQYREHSDILWVDSIDEISLDSSAEVGDKLFDLL